MLPRQKRTQLIERAIDFLDGVPAHIWDGETLPVPIEDIVDSHLGLLIREVEEMHAAPGLPVEASESPISGLLLPDRHEIWVNAAEARRWPRRRRYTVAHEVGHWVLHRGQRSIHCRAADVLVAPPAGQPTRTDRGGRTDIEDEANVFGGAVLMPPGLLRRVYDEYGGDIAMVADRFDCSLSAVNPRWRWHYEH